MMYFTSSLSIISPKNRAWKKLVDWIRRFEHILILDECSLDALKMEIEAKVNELMLNIPNLNQSFLVAITVKFPVVSLRG